MYYISPVLAMKQPGFSKELKLIWYGLIMCVQPVKIYWSNPRRAWNTIHDGASSPCFTRP